MIEQRFARIKTILLSALDLAPEEDHVVLEETGEVETETSEEAEEGQAEITAEAEDINKEEFFPEY